MPHLYSALYKSIYQCFFPYHSFYHYFLSIASSFLPIAQSLHTLPEKVGVSPNRKFLVVLLAVGCVRACARVRLRRLSSLVHTAESCGPRWRGEEMEWEWDRTSTNNRTHKANDHIILTKLWKSKSKPEHVSVMFLLLSLSATLKHLQTHSSNLFLFLFLFLFVFLFLFLSLSLSAPLPSLS